MPTYEYACKQCGEHLEVVQSFHDEPLTVCHNCGGELKKVFGNIGIVFKGSGFYKTDSRGSSSKSVKAESDSSSSSETKSSETKDTKKDAKKESSTTTSTSSSSSSSSDSGASKAAAS